MGVKLRIKRGKRVYLDIYHKGQRRWEAIPEIVLYPEDKQKNKEALRLAEKVRYEREQQLIAEIRGWIDPVRGKCTLLEYMQALGKDRDSKDAINKALRYLKQFPGGSVIQLTQINERWIDNFQAFLLKDTGLSQTTAGKYSFAVRYALRQAVRENIIIRNPAESVRGITAPESEKVYLTIVEIQRLANTSIGGELGAEVRKAFLFCCFTGLRISDIKTLTWGDIEKDPLQIKKRQQKTGRFVYIPLNRNAWDLLNDGAIHKYTELVFPLIGNTKTNTNQYLGPWAEAAGIEKKIGWHTARHTFATMTLEYGADFFTVSKLLGHTKTATTAVYTKATDKLKREAVNSLPEIDIPKAGAGNEKD